MKQIHFKTIAGLYFAVIGSAIASGYPLSTEVESVIDAALQAYEAHMTEMGQAKGSALASWLETPAGVKTTRQEGISFWYKGEARRTDSFEVAQGKATSKRRSSRADNGEVLLKYRPDKDSASITALHPIADRGWFGTDFHPSTFLDSPSFMPVISTLRYQKEKQNEHKFRLSTQQTEEGFIKLVGKSEEEVTFQGRTFAKMETFSIVLDPKHAFRPVSYHDDQRNMSGPDSMDVIDATVEWSNAGSGLGYPKSVEFKARSVMSSAELAKGPPEGMSKKEWENFKNTETRLSLAISEFQRDVEIDDKIFTLEGMGATGTTMIVDNILATTHRYGTVRVSDQELESLLKKSDVADRLEAANRLSQKDAQVADSGRRSGERDLVANANTGEVNGTGTSHRSTVGVAVVVFLLLVGCVVVTYTVKSRR